MTFARIDTPFSSLYRICDYFEQLETQENVLPDVEPGDVGRMIPSPSFQLLSCRAHAHVSNVSLTESAPVEGEPWSDIASDFDKIIMPG